MIEDLEQNYKELINKAAAIIKSGGLVAFPTETVYGLGANALDDEAVAKIFEAKGRPQDNPIIVHVNGLAMAERVAHINKKAGMLAEEFWPGPLSIVVPAKRLGSATTAGLDTIAVRMPDGDAALSLISAADLPIAAPSANRSGSPSPTNAKHVQDDLADDILVLDAGECSVGVESTVIDVTKRRPIILRPGAVTKEMIEQCIGQVDIADAFSETEEEKPASPGMKYRHYAPKAKVTVIEGDHISVAESAKYLYDKDIKLGEKPLIMASRENKKYYGKRDLVVTGSLYSPQEAAKKLYTLLRTADEDGYSSIYFEALPKEGIGFAVMNRIYKASAYNIVKV
jgi:L-threonylcarbamoyladenylate synthase